MQKRELEKLRTLNATPAMINAMSEPGIKEFYQGMNKYKYHYAARCQCLKGILKISICTREDIEKKILTPKYDIYIDHSEDCYLSRERQEDGTYKWRTSYIMNLIEDHWYFPKYDHILYMNPEGKNTIRRVLERTEKDIYFCIQKWQEECKKRIEDKKIKKLTDQWDKEMKPIKEPPKGFEHWWKTAGFYGNHHVYYPGVGAKEGYCTHCMHMVSLEGIVLRHNKGGYCPECGKAVHFISKSIKKSSVWTPYRHASCVQRYKNGLVVRSFCFRRVDRNITDSQYMIEEYKRNILVDGEYKFYQYSDYRLRGERWNEVKEHFDTYTGKLYTRNISQLLKNMRTSFGIAVDHGIAREKIISFLYYEKNYPLIEKLFKAGLYRLGKDVYERCWHYDKLPLYEKQHELAKILGIDKARMQRLRDMNGGIDTLCILQEEKQQDTVYRDEDIELLAGLECEKDLFYEEVFQHLTVEKICNYIRRQQNIRGKSARSIFDDWQDYILMMKKLKMDADNEQLLKPQDLQIAHNELVARISMLNKENEIRQKEKKYKAAERLMKSGGLKKYEYENEKYCIVAPGGIKDIYAEGIALKHCIHTCDIYFQRIEIMESYLLFLRKKENPETPWYTIEAEPGGNIRQKKSVLNETYKDLEDALPFLAEWQQWVKKNLSAEDKKLAAASDQARKKGYQQLRKEKKLIWHGRLQGTLLADALESDFMEAK